MPEVKDAERGFAQVNGARFAYEVAGEGHPLVLIHGGLMDQSMWDEQFEAFAQRYRVARFDVRGFGQSDVPAAGEQFSLFEDVYGLLKFLGIDKAYVLGLSMGGSIALDFTLAHPEMVDALILVAPGMSGDQTEPNEEELATWNQIEEAIKRGDLEQATELETRIWVDGPKRTPDQVHPEVRRRVYDMNLHNYRRMGSAELPSPQRLEPPATERLSEISAPTLLIIGDGDVRIMFIVMEKLVKGIRGAKKVVMHGVAHVPNMEQPQEFNRIVHNFLSSLPL